jgi:arsenate reductase-like glutaredoxin family protein
MTCARTQGFLASREVQYKEQVDAGKAKLGPAEALRLAREAARVVVAKGKKVTAFDMKKAPPDEKTLLAAILGPTGNLRAPTIRRGSTLLVGFDEETYRKLFD